MEKIASYLKRPSTVAFIAFATLFWVAMGYVFAGAWGLDFAPVSPDNATVHPFDSVSAWWSGLFTLAHDSVIPTDIWRGAGSPYFWNELIYAVPCFLAALGIAYYLRGRGLNPAACYGGGLAFAFSGYALTLYSAGHLGWFVVISYLPFAFGLADRAIRKGKLRHWIALGATVAWGSARQPDLWLVFTELLALYFVYAATREILSGKTNFKAMLRRTVPGVLISGAVCAATGIPQFREAMTGSIALREAQIAAGVDAGGAAGGVNAADKAWNYCTGWSMPPEDILEFAAPGVRGDSSDPHVSFGAALPQGSLTRPAGRGDSPYWGRLGRSGEAQSGNMRQHSLYAGASTIALALLAAVAWFVMRRSGKTANTGCAETAPQGKADFGDVPFWIACAIVATIFAMGSFTPVYKFVFKLPFMDKFRAPVKFHHVTEFALAILSGYGLQTFFAQGAGVRRLRTAGTVAAGILATVLAVCAIWAQSHAAGIAEAANACWGIPAAHPMAAMGKGAAAEFAGACLRGAALAACVAVCAYAAARAANPPRGFAVACICALVLAGVFDLAANAGRYLSARSVAAARAAGDGSGDDLIADLRAAPGAVAVYGYQEAESTKYTDRFTACRVTNADKDHPPRYVLLPFAMAGRMLPPDGGADNRKFYRYSSAGFKRISLADAISHPATVSVLAEMGAKPEPTEPAETPALLKFARGLSVFATLGVLAFLAAGAFRRKTPVAAKA